MSSLVQHEFAQTFTFRVYFQGIFILEHHPLQMGKEDPGRLPGGYFVFHTLTNEGLMKVAQGKASTSSTALGRI